MTRPGNYDSKDYPVWINITFGLLKLWLAVYDLITYIPCRLLFGNRMLESYKRIQAKQLNQSDLTSPWRRASHFDKLLTQEFEGCDTLDKIWLRAVKLFRNEICVGTRQVLDVELEKQSDGRLFGKLGMGEYVWKNYAEINEEQTRLGSALYQLGVKPGDRIIIMSETRAEWLITALAAFRYKFTVVTLYPTLNSEGTVFGVNEVSAEVLFTSYDIATEKILKLVPLCTKLRTVIYFPARLPTPEPINLAEYKKTFPKDFQLLQYSNLLKLGSVKIEEPRERPIPSDIAMIMYTSGTTGSPKGVILSHSNIVAGNAGQCYYVRKCLMKPHIYIGYLPAAHVLEFTAEFGSLTHGVPIGYSSPLTLTDKSSKIKPGTLGDASVLRPSLMAAVPTIMDRLYKAVMENVQEMSPFKRALFHFCYERKRAMIEQGYDTPIINLLIFKKIRAILGGNVSLMLSGGAPLNAETQRFINICFCCPVGQGYGLTETSGAGSVCEVDDLRMGRCGPNLPCVDIALRPWLEGGYRLDNRPFPQGEVLFSGPNVAQGYLNNDELTAQDFFMVRGQRWFATGDIGEFQDDGCLRIIDRKKDLIKMQHGEYVSLSKVESALLTNPLVDNVCAYGKPFSDYMVALVVPNHNGLKSLAKKLNILSDNFDELRSNQQLQNAVLTELQDHGKRHRLAKFERPEKIHLCKEVWTVDSGLLTDAMKLKRKPLEKFYKDILNQLYNGYSP